MPYNILVNKTPHTAEASELTAMLKTKPKAIKTVRVGDYDMVLWEMPNGSRGSATVDEVAQAVCSAEFNDFCEIVDEAIDASQVVGKRCVVQSQTGSHKGVIVEENSAGYYVTLDSNLQSCIADGSGRICKARLRDISEWFSVSHVQVLTIVHPTYQKPNPDNADTYSK